MNILTQTEDNNIFINQTFIGKNKILMTYNKFYNYKIL